MIKLVRVDHRLIHGQVALSWVKFLEADCILIASDALQADELKMGGLRMAKPSNVKLVMKGIDDSANALNAGVTDKYKLIILCESVADVYALSQKTSGITAVNLGGLKAGEGKRQVSKAVHLSDADELLITKMTSVGIRVSVQMVPDDAETDIDRLLQK